MALDLSNLTDKVTKLTNAADAAEALLNGISSQLRDALQNSKDLADAKLKIAEIATTIDAEAEELAAAVVAGTASEEPATP